MSEDTKDSKSKISSMSDAFKGIITKDAFQNELAKIGFGQDNILEGTTYPLTRLTKNWQLCTSMYRSSWIIRKIIDIPPTDMLKNWIKITSEIEPSKLKRIEKCIKQTKTKAKILEGIKWGRLYGGAAALILIDGQDDVLEKPLDYDDIMPGSYKGLLVFDRWSGITPNSDVITDISDPDFGLPASYNIMVGTGKTYTVHHSRILRFPGRDLPYWEKVQEQFWGESEVEIVFEELKKRDNTSYNIAYLVFLANIRVLKMGDLGQVLGLSDVEAQKDLYNVLQSQNTLMSNMGLYVMDKEDSMEQNQYSFGGLDEIYQSFMLDVAGAAEMPVTKLFGREPAGFNSSGEGDLKQYYDSISEKQETYLSPILNKLLPILCISELGAMPDDFEWDYNPVKDIENADLADLAQKYTTNVMDVYNAGVVDKAIALKELKAQSEITGQWTNITDEMIEAAEGEGVTPEDQEDIGKEISAEGSDLTSGKQNEQSNNNHQEEQKSDNVVQFQPKESWKERLSKAIEEKHGQ